MYKLFNNKGFCFFNLHILHRSPEFSLFFCTKHKLMRHFFAGIFDNF